MSNPLDGRIRAAAREEAAALLRQEIADLHEELHHLATVNKRLEERVTALEAAAGSQVGDAPVRRARGKAVAE